MPMSMISSLHTPVEYQSKVFLSLTNFASELKHLFGRSDISVDRECTHCNGMTSDADGIHKIDYDLSRRLCPLLSSCLDCQCPFLGRYRFRLESFFLRGAVANLLNVFSMFWHIQRVLIFHGVLLR
jgi:hypothetical protein